MMQSYATYALTQFRRSQVSNLDILESLHLCTVFLRSLGSSYLRKVVPIASVSVLEYITTGSWYFTSENLFERSVCQEKASNDVVIIHKDQIVSSVVTLVTPIGSRDSKQHRSFARTSWRHEDNMNFNLHVRYGLSHVNSGLVAT
jgi:hypothetical protein